MAARQLRVPLLLLSAKQSVLQSSVCCGGPWSSEQHCCYLKLSNSGSAAQNSMG
jgi:hypothetical protein